MPDQNQQTDTPPKPTSTSATPPAPVDTHVASAPSPASSEDIMSTVAIKITDAHNILIALSSDPTVDELSAAIGLSLFLDRAGKRATAIYSGRTPNALEFLNPEKTFEPSADALQDFVIALSKDKADHLRYKLDGDFVRIFITPYKSRIAKEDLEFSYGDYNIDLVLALGVEDGDDLDDALREHGRIMHDATIIDITTSATGKLGEIEWSDTLASSVCEMVTNLLYDMGGKNALEADEATALLTGIVSATDRFSNAHTTPATLQVSSRLMQSGADQQLVSENISSDYNRQSVHHDIKKPNTPKPTVAKAKESSTSAPIPKIPKLSPSADASKPKDSSAPVPKIPKLKPSPSAPAPKKPVEAAKPATTPKPAPTENPKPELKSESKPEPKLKPELKPEPESKPELKPKSESEPASSLESTVTAPAPKSEDTTEVPEPKVADASTTPASEAPKPTEPSSQANTGDSALLADLQAAAASLATDTVPSPATPAPVSVASTPATSSPVLPPVVAPGASTPVAPTPVSAPTLAVPPTPTSVVAPPMNLASPAPATLPTPAVGLGTTPPLPGANMESGVKPETVLAPTTEFTSETAGGVNKYGQMLEAALAEANGELPTPAPVVSTPAPASQPTPVAPVTGTTPDASVLPPTYTPPAIASSVAPTINPLVNPAASVAPPAPTAPEINGVPEINYTAPDAGNGILPPPPAPPVDINAPMLPPLPPTPAPDPITTSAAVVMPDVANPKPLNPLAPTPDESTPAPQGISPAPATPAPTGDNSAFKIPGM